MKSLVVGKTRGKLWTAKLESPEAATGKYTHSPRISTSSKGDYPASYADKIRGRKIRYHLSFDQKKKLEQIKEALNIKI